MIPPRRLCMLLGLYRAGSYEKLRLVTISCEVSNAVQDSIKTVERRPSATHFPLTGIVFFDCDATSNSPAIFGITCIWQRLLSSLAVTFVSDNRVDARDGGVAKMTFGGLQEPHRTLHVQIPPRRPACFRILQCDLSTL